MKPVLLELFWQHAFPLVLAAIGTGLTWALTQLGMWIAARAKGTRLGVVAERVFEIAKSVVVHVEREIRPKVVSAMEDGKLTKEEADELKREAVRLLKEALGQRGLKDLGSVLKMAAGPMEIYLSGVIERALGAQKMSGTMPQLLPISDATPTVPMRPLG